MINTTFQAQGTNFQAARQNLGLPQEVQVAEPKESLVLRSGSDAGQTSVDQIMKGLIYAQNSGAQIVNNSWGSNSSSPSFLESFKTAPQLEVIDTGVQVTHASLSPSTWRETSQDNDALAYNFFGFDAVAPKKGAPTEAAAERVQLFGDVSGHEPLIVAGHGTMVAATIGGESGDLDHLKAPTLGLSANGSETIVSVKNNGARIQLQDSDGTEDAKASILVGENNQGTLNFHNGDSLVKVNLGEFSQDSPLVGEDGLMSHLPNGPLSFMAITDHSIEAMVNGSRFYVDRQDGGEWLMSDVSSPG